MMPSADIEPVSPLQAMGHQNVAPHGFPKFSSHAKQRQWQLEHLAAAFRVFGRLGYAEGIAGHISVRDPEHHDRFWINPLAIHFSMLKASDMVCLDLRGNVVGGNTVRSSCHE
jgi:ribulose-5-phosphate 4-epimerase/fuculose-1-phosphate aldolase